MARNCPHILANLGSGPRSAFARIEGGAPKGWGEIRVDIAPECQPDIVASLLELEAHIQPGSVDIAYCSHVLEHFPDEAVHDVLTQVLQILKPDGCLVVSCPDIAAVAAAIDTDDIEKVLYTAPAGPIRALDVLYGHRDSIAKGQTHMRHLTGFTETSLAARLLSAGFEEVRVQKGRSFDISAVAMRGEPSFLEMAQDLLAAPASFD